MTAIDPIGVAMFCLCGLLVACMLVGFLTSGFTDFGFWGRNDKHKFCECCGRRVRRTGSDETPMSLVFGGYDAVYKCRSCGHVQSAHCFTYD